MDKALLTLHFIFTLLSVFSLIELFTILLFFLQKLYKCFASLQQILSSSISSVFFHGFSTVLHNFSFSQWTLLFHESSFSPNRSRSSFSLDLPIFPPLKYSNCQICILKNSSSTGSSLFAHILQTFTSSSSSSSIHHRITIILSS